MLAERGGDAKLLAGGQSLVPVLNFRLASPALLIDINELAGLSRIEATENGLRLGALVRWYQIETSPVIAEANPLLREAVRHVAHYQIRNRGTVGGSCAHADPAAELPAVAIACGAEMVLNCASGERVLAAEQFFRGALDTALLPDEMLTEIRFPSWPATRRWAFEEFARRQGDFAIAGVIALLDENGAGACEGRLVVFGASDRAVRLSGAEAIIRNGRLDAETCERVADRAAQEIDVRSDMHAPTDYKRALTRTLIARTLRRAAGLPEMEAA